MSCALLLRPKQPGKLSWDVHTLSVLPPACKMSHKTFVTKMLPPPNSICSMLPWHASQHRCKNWCPWVQMVLYQAKLSGCRMALSSKLAGVDWMWSST